MMDKIAILVVFFNKLEETIRCIESFLPSGVVIHVLNNGSKESEWTALKIKFSSATQCHFHHFEINIGPAKARNYLVQRTTEEWLFLVDNDITIEKEQEWVNWFRAAVEDNPLANVILPRLWNVHEAAFAGHPRFQINGNTVSLDYNRELATNYFPSGAAIVKREVFDRFGLFDANLFAFEDYEYAIRLLKREEALNIIEVGEITLVHDHKFQKKTIDKKAVRERYNVARLESSFNLMEQKHNVVFDHDWQWWSKKQVKEMTGETMLKKLKDKFKKLTTR